MTRTVIAVSAAGNPKRVVTADVAMTRDELVSNSEIASLISGDVDIIVNPGKLTLGKGDSSVPTGDIQLFIIPKKNKAGADYSEMGDFVTNAIAKATRVAEDDEVESLKEDLLYDIASHFNVDVDDLKEEGENNSSSEVNDAELKAAKDAFDEMNS